MVKIVIYYSKLFPESTYRPKLIISKVFASLAFTLNKVKVAKVRSKFSVKRMTTITKLSYDISVWVFGFFVFLFFYLYLLILAFIHQTEYELPICKLLIRAKFGNCSQTAREIGQY